MRLVLLTGGTDSSSTRSAIERVCRIPGVQIVGVLRDLATGRSRWKNLRYNLRREGWSYLAYRLGEALRDWTDGLTRRAVAPEGEVSDLLRRAFPAQVWTLKELCLQHGFPLIEVENLNSAGAIEEIQKLNADLGVVIGTRILKESTFRLPRLGSINLHKGSVPAYRGMPPGFWELYDGVESAGVTVHYVDSGLDTGAIVEQAEVPIHKMDSPVTLRRKLDELGVEILAKAIERIAQGDAQAVAQAPGGGKPRTKPTRAQQEELGKRLPHWHRTNGWAQTGKNLFYLMLWHGGVHSWSRKRNAGRAAILLYHRVNDQAVDSLTVGIGEFAEHLVALSKCYRGLRTADLVECLRQGKAIPDNSIAIHFDDCYQDVCTAGQPLLTAAGWPAMSFISTGFIDTDRVFGHDETKSPFRFPNMRRGDIESWLKSGLEIGAHTIHHVNLGEVSIEQAKDEVIESGRHLATISGAPVQCFSFPFGRMKNIRPEVRKIVENSGYEAMFSAHGGLIEKGCDVFDIPRLGASSAHQPLSILMELQGLSIADWLGKTR